MIIKGKGVCGRNLACAACWCRNRYWSGAHGLTSAHALKAHVTLRVLHPGLRHRLRFATWTCLKLLQQPLRRSSWAALRSSWRAPSRFCRCTRLMCTQMGRSLDGNEEKLYSDLLGVLLLQDRLEMMVSRRASAPQRKQPTQNLPSEYSRASSLGAVDRTPIT